MELSQLAVIFVFVGNAVAITLLVFLLLRVHHQTESTHALLAGGNRDLLETGRKLKDTSQQVARLAEQLAELAVQATDQRAQDQERLSTHHARLTDQMDRLAEQVAQGQRVIIEQQRNARAAAPAPPAEPLSDLLSQEVARLNAELDDVRLRLREEAARAAQQVQSVTRQRDELQRQLTQLGEAMKRTQVEKEFIEDRLVDMDATLARQRAAMTVQAQPSPLPALPPAGAAPVQAPAAG